MKKRVTSTLVWLITAVAILNLIGLILASASMNDGPLLMLAACSIYMLFAAAAVWKKYFEGLIDEKTAQE